MIKRQDVFFYHRSDPSLQCVNIIKWYNVYDGKEVRRVENIYNKKVGEI